MNSASGKGLVKFNVLPLPSILHFTLRPLYTPLYTPCDTTLYIPLHLQQNILRIICVIITGIVVLAVPDFANLMALVGSTCCTMLNFLLPGLCHYLIHKGLG